MGLVISNGLERYKVFLLAELPVDSFQFTVAGISLLLSSLLTAQISYTAENQILAHRAQRQPSSNFWGLATEH